MQKLKRISLLICFLPVITTRTFQIACIPKKSGYFWNIIQKSLDFFGFQHKMTHSTPQKNPFSQLCENGFFQP